MVSKKGQAVIPIALLDVLLTAIMLIVGGTMLTMAIAHIELQNEVVTDNVEYKILANRMLLSQVCAAHSDRTSGFLEIRPGILDKSKISGASPLDPADCFGGVPAYGVITEFESGARSQLTSAGSPTVEDSIPVWVYDSATGEYEPAIMKIGLGFR